jgi:hypothetical protein
MLNTEEKTEETKATTKLLMEAAKDGKKKANPEITKMQKKKLLEKTNMLA